MSYLIFKVNSEQYGICSSNVSGIIETPKSIKIPQMPDEIRGSINFRGEMIMLIDFRSKLGITKLWSEVEEFINMLNAREQDHINWIAELEKCVFENRHFNLARDPHKCAFGKWYYSFQTNNNILRWLLKGFEEPHNKIHAIADIALSYAENNQLDRAKEIIDSTRDRELKLLKELFEQAKEAYRNSIKELAVIIDYNGRLVGITVDSVESVEDIADSAIEDLPAQSSDEGNGLLSKIMKHPANDSFVLMVEAEKLFDTDEQ